MPIVRLHIRTPQTVVLPHLDALYAAGSEQKVCDSCFAICSFRRRGGRPDDLLAFVNESYQPAQLLPLMQYKYALKQQVQDEMAHIVQMESSAQQQQQQQQQTPQQLSEIVPPAQQPQYKLRRQKTTQLHEALRALRLSRGLFSGLCGQSGHLLAET